MGDDPDSIPEREMKVKHLPVTMALIIINVSSNLVVVVVVE